MKNRENQARFLSLITILRRESEINMCFMEINSAFNPGVVTFKQLSEVFYKFLKVIVY